MIGYMKPCFKGLPNSKDLRHAYRSVYCALCRRLRMEYGILGIPSLSYELVFLVILNLALQKEDLEEEIHTCSITPYFFVKTVNYSTPIFERAANLSILMMCGELEDNLNDEQRMRDRIFVWLYNKPKIKVISSDPDLFFTFTKRLELYHNIERKRIDYFEMFSAYDLFLESIADYLLLDKTSTITREEYCKLIKLLGRWLYYIDAVDDYEKDVEKNTFNPFYQKENLSFDDIICEFNELMVQIDVCIKRLPITRYKELLNILCNETIKKKTNTILEKSSYFK